MRLLTALLALAPAVSAALQDNRLYRTDVYNNGTVVTYDAESNEIAEILHEGPLVDAYREAFTDEPPSARRSTTTAAVPKKKPRQLSKRAVSCWGTALDHEGVDIAVEWWKSYVNPLPWSGCSSSTTRSYYAVYSRGVQVYYCLNAFNYCGSLDLVDVNYALYNMDQACVPYTSSYFQWNSPEIFGKALASTAICLG